MTRVGATMIWATHASSLVGLLALSCYASLVLLVLVAAAGAPVPTGALFIALGALSVQPHGPNFLALGLLGTAAGVSGDLFDYALGRMGRPVLYTRLLRPLLRLSGTGIKDANKALGGSRGMMIFLTKFTLTPLASPLSILAGAGRAPLARFLVWDAPGDAVAVIGNLAIGRWLGPGLITHSPHAAAFWGVLAFAGVAPGLVFLLVLWFRISRRRRHVQIGSGAPRCGLHLAAPNSIPYHESANAAAQSSMEADRAEPFAPLPWARHHP